MTNWLNKLLVASSGRPLTPDEADRVAEYGESLPDRLAAARRLEESAKWLTKQMTDVVGPKATEWGLPREALVNDFVQSLTAVAHAMLLDDRSVLDETVVRPFQSLAAALDIPGEDLGDLFHAAWAALSRRLEARPAQLLHPYFHWAATALTDGEGQALIETPAPLGV